MIFIGLFLLSYIITYFIKNFAIKKSLLAKVTKRSSHLVPTPHGGGVAIAIVWFIGLFYFYMNGIVEKNIFYTLLLGLVISIIGLIDDIFELSFKLRVFAQFSIAVLALYLLGGLERIDLYFFIIENQIITSIFATILIVWFINLYNFLDGIDGYAGSEAIFLGIAGFLLFNDVLFLVLISSVFGFLIWNWDKAKIFMGDTGSTLLGYNIAIFTIYYSNQDSMNLWIWLTLFGLFWFDATFTLLRRYKNGENISQAHKKHAYQRLTQSGLSHSRVVLYAMILNVVLFFLIYFSSYIFISFFISMIFLYAFVKYADNKKIL